MAIGISTNLNVNAGAPLDNKYGPYTGTTEALAKAAADTATAGQRYKGLTVGLIIGSNALKEYWYQDGNTLIEKIGGTTGTVTGVSVATANGFTGSATAAPTPAITISLNSLNGILKGSGASVGTASAGTDYQAPISLTTNNSYGAATFNPTTGALNIPIYNSPNTNTTNLFNYYNFI